jgi:hypothetical protein
MTKERAVQLSQLVTDREVVPDQFSPTASGTGQTLPSSSPTPAIELRSPKTALTLPQAESPAAAASPLTSQSESNDVVRQALSHHWKAASSKR